MQVVGHVPQLYLGRSYGYCSPTAFGRTHPEVQAGYAGTRSAPGPTCMSLGAWFAACHPAKKLYG